MLGRKATESERGRAGRGRARTQGQREGARLTTGHPPREPSVTDKVTVLVRDTLTGPGVRGHSGATSGSLTGRAGRQAGRRVRAPSRVAGATRP